MKTRFTTRILLYAAGVLLIFIVNACSKSDSSNPNPTPNPTTKATIPTITTAAASAITGVSAKSGGSISSDGGAAITAKGVCWSTAANPTTANSKTSDGTGTDSFVSLITGFYFSSTTTYYIRAYATNSAGTAYGNQITITTNDATTIPTVTIATTDAEYNSMVIQSTITATGAPSASSGPPVTAQGVCWSTTQNPTIASTKTSDAITAGTSFVSTITGLSVNTTYYVRAYATNAKGTAYSDQVTLTTAYRIGQGFGGGIIMFVDATKLHGFIVTKEDQSASAKWDGTPSGSAFISTDASSNTDGAGNTAKIVAAIGTNNAAGICRACRDGGYSDWFLPATFQLVLLHNNLAQIYPDTTVPGYFGGTSYWGSTEGSYVAMATYVSVYTGSVQTDVKTNNYAVRAIRAF